MELRTRLKIGARSWISIGCRQASRLFRHPFRQGIGWKKEYPFYSPYQFAGNTPIQATDLDGAEPDFVADRSRDGKIHLKLPVIGMFAKLYDSSYWESGAKSNILIDQGLHNKITGYQSGAITMGYEMIFTKNYIPAGAEKWLKLIVRPGFFVLQRLVQLKFLGY